MRIDSAIYDTCANCGKDIKSYNKGASWVHGNMESACPSPGWATPAKTKEDK